jgi:hypothetical protein
MKHSIDPITEMPAPFMTFGLQPTIGHLIPIGALLMIKLTMLAFLKFPRRLDHKQLLGDPNIFHLGKISIGGFFPTKLKQISTSCP